MDRFNLIKVLALSGAVRLALMYAIVTVDRMVSASTIWRAR